MASTSDKKYHHGDLRQALLDEGRALINETGPDQLSLRELARRLGVSAMAPYRHYADKNSLLASIATEGFLNLTERLQAVGGSDTSGRRPLLQGGVIYVKFALEQPALFRLMFSRRWPGSSHPELHAARAASFNALMMYLESAADSGRRLAHARGCWSLVHGLALLLLDGLLQVPQDVPTDDWLTEIIASTAGDQRVG